jgi:uncharacterized protein (DUF302 family)
MNSKPQVLAMNRTFVTDTQKPFEQACSDLKAAVTSHDFGILATHDLAAILRSKNIDFPESCLVFEVCNPQQAAKVLQVDMSLSMVLPCRISVYTEAGKTMIGMVRPVELLQTLSNSSELLGVAQDVDSSMTSLILEAAAFTSGGSTCECHES